MNQLLTNVKYLVCILVPTILCNKEQLSSSLVSSAGYKYNDYVNIPEHVLPRAVHKNMRGRCQETFPIKLFKILESGDSLGYSSIVSWLPHGQAFKIYSIKRFKKEIITKYFLINTFFV